MTAISGLLTSVPQPVWKCGPTSMVEMLQPVDSNKEIFAITNSKNAKLMLDA